MKTCVLAIAAEFEKPYIDEWAGWHWQLGFDDIWVVTNNWDMEGGEDYLKTYRRDGKVIQLQVYNEWFEKHKNDYDWVLVCDLDEFLYIPGDLKAFLEDHAKDYCLGVPWVHFGDGGQGTPTEGSVIDRFQRCEGLYNRHVKPLLNTRLLAQANRIFFVNPHFACVQTGALASHGVGGVWLPWTDIFGNPSNGPYNKFEGQTIDNSRPFLAHYYTKTLTEWRKRRGPEHMRADCHEYVTEYWFHKENHNEKECRLLHDRKNRQP